MHKINFTSIYTELTSELFRPTLLPQKEKAISISEYSFPHKLQLIFSGTPISFPSASSP